LISFVGFSQNSFLFGSGARFRRIKKIRAKSN
jgi:hypothetical protein